MRSVKAGAFFGALWLLGGCTVPEDSPVTGSKSLSEVSGREIVAMCDWALDYMGGYAPDHPDSDEGAREARHRCPVTEEDLWEGVDTIRYILWNEEGCSEFVLALRNTGCNLVVDDFELLVRNIADDPCLQQTFQLGACSYTYLPDFEE